MKSKNRSVVRPGAYYAPQVSVPTQKQIDYYDGLLAAIQKNGLGDGSTFSKANKVAITQSINLMRMILKKNNINHWTGEPMKEGDPGYVKAYNAFSFVHVCYCENCQHYQQEKRDSGRHPGGVGSCELLDKPVKTTDFCSWSMAKMEGADDE